MYVGMAFLLARACWQMQPGPPEGGPGLEAYAAYILSIITWPKPEQLTWVAPSIRRAKS